jgi:SAM-dependent methyltransferase
MVNTEDVRAAYRLILGRDPENEDVLKDHAQQAKSLEDLVKAFLCSPEFLGVRSAQPSPKPLDWPPIEVQVDADKSQLSSMMTRVQANWNQLGLSDPHWSVITHDSFRASNIHNTVNEFYEGGKTDVERLQRVAERTRVQLTGFTRCFELGCGVGRTTIWLAGLFERVIAADISPTHLALARQALDHVERGNVDLVHLDAFSALESVPEFDVLFSVIVLQHNPPPLIVALLKSLLNKLRPGGVAYFQVPTYRLNYHFQVDEYLRSASPTDGIEMHVIPQYVLFDILNRSRCNLLECRENDWTGDHRMISNSIFLRKQPYAP